MRAARLTAVVLSLVACTGSNSGQTVTPPPAPAPPPSTVSATQVPPAARTTRSPMPIINVGDMMGAYPQQTVFVATSDQVSAVTLLNHFTRYRIATNGVAQVSADSTGQWLYVLDADLPGLHRLRVFDVATGTERAVQAGITAIAEGQHVLSAAVDGRVLALKADATHSWVDAYDRVALEPVRLVMEGPGCGDRLLTSTSRAAIICLSTGQIAVDDLRGNHTLVDGALAELVAATMAGDGALYVATADQQLARVKPGTSTLESVAWPTEWSGTILGDGLAFAEGGGSVVVAERNADVGWVRVGATNTSPAQRSTFRLAGVPQGGILALWPFAYYTVDRTVRHVDLTSGLLETMTEIGPSAVPAAVVNG